MLNKCLNFQQVVKFIADEFDAQEYNDSEDHIRKCEKCNRELDFVKQLMDSASKNGEVQLQPYAGEHISEEFQERYFQHTLAEAEIASVHAHVLHCHDCFEAFSSIFSLALTDASPEDQSILDRIETVEITGRLKPYKDKFIIPKKQPVTRRQPARPRLGLIPAWGYSFTLAVVSIIGYFGYQQFDSWRIMGRADLVFETLAQNHYIPDTELRPTGSFNFDRIGNERDEPVVSKYLPEISSLQEAVESKPGNAKLNHYLATAYFFSDDMESAEKYYKKALELDPSNAKIYNDLALIDMYRDLKDAAIQNLQKALNLNGEFPEAQYNLAVVLELSHDKSASVAAWQQYIKLDADPNSDWYQVAQKHLLDLK